MVSANRCGRGADMGIGRALPYSLPIEVIMVSPKGSIMPLPLRTVAGASLLAVASLAPLASAWAQDRIGAMALATNEVTRLNESAATPLRVDDAVFRDETVRTGKDSAAKFVFVDATNLALGPVSTVKLDRFVFNDQSTYSQAAVNLAKGAFRFSSGGSPKGAYEIRTGNATIGVRGTILNIWTQPGRTVVTLVEGGAAVTPRAFFDGDPRTLTRSQLKAYHGAELVHPGDTVVIDSRGARSSREKFEFAALFCGAQPALCTRDRYAGLTGPGATPAGKLCGR
jgi:ferric-dicitrate binding protein FerR (iron transport regulator)